MPKSFSDTVNSILMKEGRENSATLKPGSGFKEPMHVLEKGKVPDTEDQVELIGKDAYTPDPASGTNTGGRKAETIVKKDTSKSSQSARGATGEKFNPTDRPYGSQPQKETSPGVKASGKPGSGSQKLSGSPIDPKKSTQNKDGVNEGELPETIDLEALVEQMVEDGLTEEEIEATLDQIMEDYDLVEEDEETLSEEQVDEEELPEVEVPEIQVDVTEDVKALFEGETFSEEFQEKAKVIFETAIKTRLNNYQAQLDEAFAAALIEATEDISENMAKDVEDYLGYVCEQWMQENEVPLQAQLRTEWTNEFMTGLRNLMIENYIDIPEDKVDVVEQLAAEVAQLKESLNDEIEINVALTKVVNESKKWEAFAQTVDGLTDTQVDKLRGLVENVDFEDEESFVAKVETLKESYFPSNVSSPRTLETEIVAEDEKKILSEENLAPQMQRYVKTLGRLNK